MRRPAFTVVVVVVGVVLLADYLVVNDALALVASVFVDAVILVAAGAALAAGASLALRRSADLLRKRGEPFGAVLVLGGIAAVLVAGLRPGAVGATDPAVTWIITALIVPIGATLFAMLFVSTLSAARHSVASRSADATLLVAAALVTLVLLLPLEGAAGGWLAGAAAWGLALPIGAAFRGLLMAVAILTAVFAARTLLGIGPHDE